MRYSRPSSCSSHSFPEQLYAEYERDSRGRGSSVPKSGWCNGGAGKCRDTNPLGGVSLTVDAFFRRRIRVDRTEAFRVLASADRQLVLHELTEGNETTIEGISRQVAARRHRIDPERITDGKVERAHIRLVHTHFPRLREVGLVDIDWDDGEVAFTDEECVDQLFDAAAELESWPPDELLEHPSRSR